MFLAELREKHDVGQALFLGDTAPWLYAAFHRQDLRFQYERHENQNAVERVVIQEKRRTNQFGDTFSHAGPATAETWLLAEAFRQNQLI